MPEHYGIWSVVPPLIAIALAMLTRRVAISLFCGIAAAALILGGGQPWVSLKIMWAHSLWPTISDQDHLRVLAFTVFLGAMIGVIHQAGGMEGMVAKIRPWASTRRRGQLTGWLLGLLIFFDDYANTLLLGSTMRPVVDRLKISREKLAYIVDSTAAPVAGIALLSTWVGFEISQIQDGLDGLHIATASDAAFRIFVTTIIYRFYPVLALLMVGMIAVTGRDFGPMLAAERRALSGADPAQDVLSSLHVTSANQRLGRWYVAVIPIVAVIIVLLATLFWTGRTKESSDAGSLWVILSAGDAFLSLVVASLFGLIVAIALARYSGQLSVGKIWEGFMRGAQLMMPALLILWLAWSLTSLLESPNASDANHLRTADYLSGMISGTISVHWLPTVVFLLASIVAYCTGTSWATMTILTPLVIGVTWKALLANGETPTTDHHLLLASVGSVLAGSIFGDHCSPISDTTILSSRASQCDHVAHVWTQMPYALTVAAISVICGTIPVGFGLSAWVAMPLAIVALFTAILVFGSVVQEGRGDTVEQ
ncbi:MAG TPA: Na+/H+ antiporter NhaC family protein [Pirellulales bacterium]|nr:Na+/H+ antiporter NhaC family protein [Pirellulales bacterium]